MATEVSKLKLARKGNRTQITKLCSKIEDLLLVEPCNLILVNSRLNRVRQIQELLQSLNSQILEQLTEEEYLSDFETCEEYEDQVIEVAAAVEARRKTGEGLSDAASNSGSSHSQPPEMFNASSDIVTTTPSQAPSQQSSQLTSIAPSLFRLSPIEIQPFDGEILQWPAFWEQFSSAVDRSSSYTKEDKLLYLKNRLKGEALDVLYRGGSGELTYDKAVKLLENTYAKGKHVRNRHLHELLNIRPVLHIEDFDQVKVTVNNIRLHARTLRRLGVEPDFFFEQLKKAFPKEVFVQLSLKYGDNTSLDEFLEFTLAMARAIYGWHEEGGEEIRRSGFSLPPTAAALVVATRDSNARMNPTQYCMFCDNESHWTRECLAPISIQVKRELLLKKSRCVSCFKKGHIESECDFRFFECVRCKGKHFVSMCPGHPYAHVGEEEGEGVKSVMGKVSAYSVNVAPCKKILLQTVVAHLVQGSQTLKIRALLDTGSERTFIKASIAKAMRLTSRGKETLSIGAFDGLALQGSFDRMHVCLKNIKNAEKMSLLALSVPRLTSHQTPHTLRDLRGNLDLSEEGLIELADDYDENVGLEIAVIIGMDYLTKFMTGRAKKLTEDIMATETKFGWTIPGVVGKTVRTLELITPKIPEISVAPKTSLCLTIASLRNFPEDVNQAVRQLWELDHLGIIEAPYDISENSFDDLIRKNTVYQNNRYTVPLPWYEDKKAILSNNRNIASVRYFSLLRRLNKRPGLLERYNKAMLTYIRNGWAEEVDETLFGTSEAFYLPHRFVEDETKTTALRIVFDASSHAKGELSLNDCLFPGNERSLDLLQMLINFCIKPWGVTTDIKKAFLQISLAPKDRRYLRFFWMDPSSDLSQQSFKTKIYQMTCVTFGVTCSPYLLKRVIFDHVSKYVESFPETVTIVKQALYVDDLISSVSTVLDVHKLAEELKTIFVTAGFELHPFFTNLKRENLTEPEQFNSDRQTTTVLGLGWDIDTDKLTIEIPDFSKFNLTHCTKRELAKLAASIFDPLGLIFPLTIGTRLFMQEAWVAKIDWDQPLNESIRTKLKLWIDCARKLQAIQFRRFLFSESTTNMQNTTVHVFADASPLAYSAVAYLVYKDDRNFKTEFLLAKFRVAPVKTCTLPRLELLAARLAARIAVYLRKNMRLPIADYYFWSDSAITLFWIKNFKKRAETFIENRVQEIRASTSIDNWGHCPSADNPADLATRFSKIFPNLEDTIWWSGPEWLKYEKSQWPTLPVLQQFYINLDTCSTSAIVVINETGVHNLLNIEKFSSFHKLIRVTGYVLKFSSSLFKNRHKDDLNMRRLAEIVWLKSAQSAKFNDTIKALVNNDRLALTRSSLRKLLPFCDLDGILRVQGRLQCSELTYDQKHPIILPADHPLTTLIVKKTHIEQLHSGVSTTLAILRQKYWVISGRRTCRKILKTCVTCIRFKASHLEQPTAPLPSERVDMIAPFTGVGIDYAGPVYVKNELFSITKAYIALFSCTTSRALHLELVSNASANNFLLALQRFIARRGVPHTIWSDNATIFTKTASDLRFLNPIQEDGQIDQYFLAKQIQWKQIAPRAPWWGGFYERMVASIKDPLRKVLGRATLTYEELETVLTEIEAVVNSRPLAALGDDVDDLQIITPALLLYGRPLQRIPVDDPPTADSSLTQRAQLRTRLLASLIKRWRNDYLLQLRSIHFIDNKQPCILRVGQIVLLNEFNKPKCLWPLARVTQVHYGRDGHIRSCSLLTGDNRTIKRPINHLTLLEELPVTAPGEFCDVHNVTEAARKTDESGNVITLRNIRRE